MPGTEHFLLHRIASWARSAVSLPGDLFHFGDELEDIGDELDELGDELDELGDARDELDELDEVHSEMEVMRTRDYLCRNSQP